MKTYVAGEYLEIGDAVYIANDGRVYKDGPQRHLGKEVPTRIDQELKQVVFEVYQVATLVEICRQFDVVKIESLKQIGTDGWSVTLQVEKEPLGFAPKVCTDVDYCQQEGPECPECTSAPNVSVSEVDPLCQCGHPRSCHDVACLVAGCGCYLFE